MRGVTVSSVVRLPAVAAAGWADNGNYGGNLVTATAVCVAESGGNASIYYCDRNGTVGTYRR